jgi:elongation factor G
MVDPTLEKFPSCVFFPGSLTTTKPLTNVNKGEKERIRRLLVHEGQDGEDLKEVVCGDIVVIPQTSHDDCR